MQSATMSSTKKSEQPYIHWIHCNRCYETFIKKERKFFFLACQHVVCESCQVEIKQDTNGSRVFKCTICQKETRAVEINNNMPKKLKELFHPAPYLDGINIALALGFQTWHRQRYLEYLERKQNSIKEEWKIAEQRKELCKKTYRELQQLKAERKQLAKRVLEIKQQKRHVNAERQNKPVHPPSSSSSAASATGAQKNPLSSGIASFSEFKSKNSFIL